MRIAAELSNATLPSGRQCDRTRVHMNAAFREGCGRAIIDITDISPTGARIESHLSLCVEHHIWLKLNGLEALEARVAWVNRHEAGCEFVRPLHPAVFDRIVSLCR